MTVQGAIEEIVKETCQCCETPTECKWCEYKIAIECMEEVEQYRALGTVEELQEAREKQVAKKVIGIKAKLITRHCPSCQEWAVFELKRGMKFCPSCGQKLDWSEEDD